MLNTCVSQHAAGLPTAELKGLRLDWDAARAKIEVHLSLKLAHWLYCHVSQQINPKDGIMRDLMLM